jgi:hypothetical protein
MKRNIAAAIALEDLDSACRQRIGGSEYISRARIASKRNDRRMFEQQQHVADLASLAQIDQLPLQPQSFCIIKLTELDDRNHVAIEIIGSERVPVDHEEGCLAFLCHFLLGGSI